MQRAKGHLLHRRRADFFGVAKHECNRIEVTFLSLGIANDQGDETQETKKNATFEPR
jgi:hypothetical protein